MTIDTIGRAFEVWCADRRFPRTQARFETWHAAWQFATLAERERCAKVCDEIQAGLKYSHEKQSAGECADKIRSG